MIYSANPPVFRQHSAASPEGGVEKRRSYSAVLLLPIGRRINTPRRDSSQRVNQSAGIPPNFPNVCTRERLADRAMRRLGEMIGETNHANP